MRHLVETKNYTEIYNSYTRWIQDNRQFFRTGKIYPNNPEKGLIKRSFSDAEKTYGFRSFLKTFVNTEEEIISLEQECSEFLAKNPQKFDPNKDLFASTFTKVLKIKNEKIEKKQKKTDNTLNEFFEQKALELESPTIKTIDGLNETAQTICALADKGAKHIESPDGWKVQF